MFFTSQSSDAQCVNMAHFFAISLEFTKKKHTVQNCPMVEAGPIVSSRSIKILNIGNFLTHKKFILSLNHFLTHLLTFTTVNSTDISFTSIKNSQSFKMNSSSINTFAIKPHSFIKGKPTEEVQ